MKPIAPNVIYDQARYTHAQAVASIEALAATIAKKRILAPFAGRVGIREINIGEFLNKGDVVIEGLNAGDQVVTAGQMKLRNGAPVTRNHSVLPSNSPTPQPAES